MKSIFLIPYFRRVAVGVLSLCIFWLNISSAYSQTLDEITQIARGGAPGLALSLLDQQQPSVTEDPTAWFAWERQRAAILQTWQQWERGIERFQNLPPELPARIRRWAESQLAWFHLANGDGAAARVVLRDLLWLADGAAAEEITLWRRLLVRSYLLDGLAADAMAAMQRYQQDYQDPDPEWRLLQVRVLLGAQQAEAAVALVAGLEGEAAHALRLLAELRKDKPVTEIYQTARDLAWMDATSPRGRALFWSLAAQAAKLMASGAGSALALDQGLRYAQQLTADDELFPLDAEQLWQAYLDFGQQVGNSAQLLLGNDESWFTEAEASLQQTPVRARALLAVMALHAATPENRQRAHTRLAESLIAEETGGEVLRRLYLDSKRFPTAADIPTSVSHRLIDLALNASDIQTASYLFSALEQAPPDADAFAWNLRRARVLIMDGRATAGAKVLQSLFTPETSFDESQLDRFLQVVFDLQAVGAHAEALQLLTHVEGLVVIPQRQRELWFWRADSLKALGRYPEAAYAYLRSATLIPNSADPWSQTARYNAAEALGKAGLIEDAEHIYYYLLKITPEPNRAAVLRNQLQRLLLQRQSENQQPH